MPLTDPEYRRLSDALLAAIEGQVDVWLQDDVVDIDAQRTGGLLELTLPDRSKLVLNTQPPLQEIWLASRRGGFHFRWQDGAWCDTKSGETLAAVFSREASAQAGCTLHVKLP